MEIQDLQPLLLSLQGDTFSVKADQYAECRYYPVDAWDSHHQLHNPAAAVGQYPGCGGLPGRDFFQFDCSDRIPDPAGFGADICIMGVPDQQALVAGGCRDGLT